MVAAPWLFSVVFGPDWTEAGEYAQFLALAYLGQFAVTPVSTTLILSAPGHSVGLGMLPPAADGGRHGGLWAGGSAGADRDHRARRRAGGQLRSALQPVSACGRRC